MVIEKEKYLYSEKYVRFLGGTLFTLKVKVKYSLLAFVKL